MSSESQIMTKQWLAAYVSLRMENENRLERLARLKNETEIPAIRQGDGSQHSPSTGGRIERAIIRAMEYEEQIKPLIEENRRTMRAIEARIDALPDPMEREVLRLRYIDGDGGCRQMPWKDVALAVFGDNDDRHLLATYRLHGRAIQHIEKIDA